MAAFVWIRVVLVIIMLKYLKPTDSTESIEPSTTNTTCSTASNESEQTNPPETLQKSSSANSDASSSSLYQKHYDQKIRKRKFDSQWTKTRPWLKDSESGMTCTDRPNLFKLSL